MYLAHDTPSLNCPYDKLHFFIELHRLSFLFLFRLQWKWHYGDIHYTFSTLSLETFFFTLSLAPRYCCLDTLCPTARQEQDLYVLLLQVSFLHRPCFLKIFFFFFLFFFEFQYPVPIICSGPRCAPTVRSLFFKLTIYSLKQLPFLTSYINTRPLILLSSLIIK